jgi:hypothetical protein
VLTKVYSVCMCSNLQAININVLRILCHLFLMSVTEIVTENGVI